MNLHLLTETTASANACAAGELAAEQPFPPSPGGQTAAAGCDECMNSHAGSHCCKLCAPAAAAAAACRCCLPLPAAAHPLPSFPTLTRSRPKSVCLCPWLPEAPLQTAGRIVILQHPHELK